MVLKEQCNTRFDYIDFLKGVGIFLVVWGHTMTPRSVYIYSFHMPLFFFLSGFVHKDRPFKDFLLRKVNTLYIPYIIFTVGSWLFYLFRNLPRGNSHFLHQHLIKITSVFTGTADNGGNNPIWFLSCIFVVSIAYLLIKQTVRNPGRFWTIIGMCSLAGYFLSLRNLDLPFKMDVAFSGIVFYAVGRLVKELNIPQWVSELRNRSVFLLILLCAAVHVITAYWNIQAADISKVNMAGNVLGNYFLFYISALFGIAFFFIIGYQVHYLHLFNFLGANSLLIIAAHKPVLIIINDILGNYFNTDSNLYGLAASILAILLIQPGITYLNRTFPQILGKKPFIASHGR